jgi:hypothetical protein
LCCSSWLTDFKSVNTNAARYQNLSINQSKLSGQCGRLKCCLNYELDTYLDALQFFPDDADVLEIERSRAFLVKKDIFKNLMWYTLPESNKQYPLSLERVRKIKELNRQGIRPEELEPVELQGSKPKEVEPVYADLVGQISLKSLEKTSRKRRDKERNQQQDNNRQQQGGGNRGRQQGGGGNRPQQQAQQNRNGGNNQQRPNNGGGNRQQGPQNRGPQRNDNRNRNQQRPQQNNNREDNKPS